VEDSKLKNEGDLRKIALALLGETKGTKINIRYNRLKFQWTTFVDAKELQEMLESVKDEVIPLIISKDRCTAAKQVELDGYQFKERVISGIIADDAANVTRIHDTTHYVIKYDEHQDVYTLSAYVRPTEQEYKKLQRLRRDQPQTAKKLMNTLKTTKSDKTEIFLGSYTLKEVNLLKKDLRKGISLPRQGKEVYEKAKAYTPAVKVASNHYTIGDINDSK
jgi:hypothetical protein